MSTLFCICGKIGSGKSTFGLALKKRHKTVIFNVDELTHPLFGETPDRATFDEKSNTCLDYICGISRQILDNGVSVVLDFGFWRRSGRGGNSLGGDKIAITGAEKLAPHCSFLDRML